MSMMPGADNGVKFQLIHELSVTKYHLRPVMTMALDQ